ncbi:MAG: HD domain-containing protein [Lachnospiraceae bacterium]|nr:HD domain-containing protein [Lachnospiraceae bacterium]
MQGVFYTIAFLLALAMFVVLVAQYKTRISIFYFLLYVSVVISNFGYMQLAYSKDITSAVFANQIVYLGGSFVPFFMLMCIADLCKIKVWPVYQIFMLIYSGFIFTLVSTVGATDLYYTDVRLVIENGISRIEKSYGPLHVMYPIYLVTSGVVATAFIIYSFRRRKEVSYITSTSLLIFMLITNFAYVFEKIFSMKIEIIPFSLLISLGGTLFLLRRISMYEVKAISANSMVDSLSYGFFICDSNGKYLGSDEAAKFWFPEIRELPVDRVIKYEGTEFLQQVGKWIKKEDVRDVVYIEVGNNIYEARHSIIRECRHHNIHSVYLRDETKQQQYNKLVQQFNEELELDVERKTENIKHIQNDILMSMASIVENRDSNTGGHIARTSDIVLIFVDHLQSYRRFSELTDHMAKSIVKAAPLHDFGKIAIPDIVLNKPGKFDEDDYKVMKQHTVKGATIVAQILRSSDDEKFREIAINVAHYHHERWDGTGYPEGLKGEEIPFEARVMALADVFDALVSKRVYKESFGYDKAFEIIESSCGTHFDPELCKSFLECRLELEALYDSYVD